MTAEPSEVYRAGMALSPNDREVVALRLLHSVDEPHDRSAIDAAWGAEIDRRVNDILSGKVEAIPYEQVKAELAARRSSRATWP